MVKVAQGSAVLLSNREKEVIQWMCRGKTNWEIGQLMNISEYTVKNHVSKILKKIEASNRQHAVAKALEMGLVSLSEDNSSQ